MTSNVTAITTARPNAKAKTASKAERLRANMAKANAIAAKALPRLDFATLANDLVNASKANDGKARTMAHYMNNAFADAMASFRCHWSAFTPANCRTDNEKAILARINGYRKEVQELAEKKGLANINKPWSDMRRLAIEIHRGGGKVERITKPLEQIQRTDLLHAYKAGMKEERQTDAERDLNIAIGELLIAYFKEDLTKY